MKIKLTLPEKTLIPLRDGTYFFYDSCEQEIDSKELSRILPSILPYLTEVSCDDEKNYEQVSNILSSYKQVKVSEPVAQKTTKPIEEDLIKEEPNDTKEENKSETLKQEEKSETEKTKTTTRKRNTQKKQEEDLE